MRDGICVQIPAYRDPELPATVADLVGTAARPERLTIHIAWQYGPEELGLACQLRRLGAVHVIEIPARESQGCNWARSLLQQEWAGEPYTLLLDSHHRFAPGWDDRLVRLLHRQREAGSDDPILTGYLPPYVPARDPEGRVLAVYRMDLAERCDGLLYRLTGHPVPDWRNLDAPLRAGFASLHLLFAEGSLNDRLRFDPDVYFFADEVAVALRAHTLGYDLFHPHLVLGWHLYDRSSRVPHWADHAGAGEQQARSLARLRELYSGSLQGRYGLGQRRTVADYERLVGRRLIDDSDTANHTGG